MSGRKNPIALALLSILLLVFAAGCGGGVEGGRANTGNGGNSDGENPPADLAVFSLPELSFYSPSSNPYTVNAVTESESISLNGLAKDEEGIQSVKWSSGNGDSGTCFLDTDTSTWWVTVPLKLGNNTFTVTATDNSGNATTGTRLIILKVGGGLDITPVDNIVVDGNSSVENPFIDTNSSSENPIIGDTNPPLESAIIDTDPPFVEFFGVYRDFPSGVDVSSYVTAIFSKDMDPSTINSSTFTLSDGSATVPCTITYYSTIKTATFKPEQPLAFSTVYTATLTTGAKDKTGLALASPSTKKFTTARAERAHKPRLYPETGVYEGAQRATLTCFPGETIYYTTDGTLPTTASAVYNGPIPIGRSTTITAFLVKDGLMPSEFVSSHIYIKTAGVSGEESVATPGFTPMANATSGGLTIHGVYESAQNVTINCATQGATIYYTTDGTMPTFASKVYNGAIKVSQDTTITAFAAKDAMIPSGFASFCVYIHKAYQYIVQPPFREEWFNVYYPTWDPHVVTSSSIALNGFIKGTSDIESVKWSSDNGDSGTCQLNMGYFDNITGFMAGDQRLFFADAYWWSSTAKAQLKPGANRFTFTATDVGGSSITQTRLVIFDDGVKNPPAVKSSAPGRDSSKVDANGDVTAVFSKEMDPSTIDSSTFILRKSSTAVPGTVTYDPSTRTATFHPEQPLEFSTVYTAILNTGLKDNTGYGLASPHIWNFTTASGEMVAPPVFSHSYGLYKGAQELTITCATPGATIYYSTDDSVLDRVYHLYTGPITVSQNTRFWAFAEKEGLIKSYYTGTSLRIPIADPSSVYSGISPPLVSFSSPASNPYTETMNRRISIGGVAQDEDGIESISWISGNGGSGACNLTPVTGGTYWGAGYFDLKPGANTFTVTATDRGGNSTTATMTVILDDIAYRSPSVHYTNPRSNGSEVDLNSNVTVIFSKDMDPSTINSSTFTLSDGLTTVPGTVTYDKILYAAVFTPSQPLEALTNYTATVTTDAKDYWDYGLVSPHVISFTTGMEKAAPPVFTPASGFYEGAQDVTLTCATPGATIHYTTDGTVPTPDSPVYSEAITVGQNTSFKAIAVKSGMSESPVAYATFNIREYAQGNWNGYFPDPALDACIMESTGGNRTPEALASISVLYCGAHYGDPPEKAVLSLDGIEQLSGLKELAIYRSSLGDLAPIAGLVSLNRLELSGNQIKDITPLYGLTGLTYLSIGNNEIVDLSPLSGMTSLEDLWAGENQISDISVVSKLSRLKKISVNKNQIVDISPVSGLLWLTDIRANYNKIQFLELSALPSIYLVYLSNNELEEITGLTGLSSLRELDLRYNNRYFDLKALQELYGLDALDTLRTRF